MKKPYRERGFGTGFKGTLREEKDPPYLQNGPKKSVKNQHA